ncbi:hypothetical protein Tco_0847069 [Tanacetum coccineum]
MDPNGLDTYDINNIYDQEDVEEYTQYLEYFEQYQDLDNDEAGSSGATSRSRRRTRTYIPRQREDAARRLMEDYFGDEENPPKYPKRNFRRMHRMSSTLFRKIVNDIIN